MEMWGHLVRRNCVNSNRGGVKYVVCTTIVRHEGGHTFSLGARRLGATHQIFCVCVNLVCVCKSCARHEELNNYVSREKECGLEDELLRHRGGGVKGYNSNTEWGGGEGGGGCRKIQG